MHGIAANGSNASYSALQFDASVADADGVTYQNAKTWGVAPDLDLTPGVGGVSNIPPGAAWKFQIPFSVPNDFVPVKVLIAPADHKYKAFRIEVSKADQPH